MSLATTYFPLHLPPAQSFPSSSHPILLLEDDILEAHLFLQHSDIDWRLPGWTDDVTSFTSEMRATVRYFDPSTTNRNLPTHVHCLMNVQRNARLDAGKTTHNTVLPVDSSGISKSHFSLFLL